MSFTNIIWSVLILVISAIPLNIAVKMLGGDSSILKVLLANFIAGIAAGLLSQTFGFFGAILSFIAMLFIYKIMFEIGWFRAFIAWILQGIIIGILALLLVVLFGVSLIGALA